MCTDCDKNTRTWKISKNIVVSKFYKDNVLIAQSIMPLPNNRIIEVDKIPVYIPNNLNQTYTIKMNPKQTIGK